MNSVDITRAFRIAVLDKNGRLPADVAQAWRELVAMAKQAQNDVEYGILRSRWAVKHASTVARFTA